MESILTTFERECAGLVIDAKLAKAIATYQASWRTRNEEHIAFFSGKTLGVQVVRFLPSDRDRWFQDILRADEDILTEELHALPTVNPDFFVSSDAMNLSCAWLLHAFYKSKLPEKERHEAMINVALVLQYKYFTSILYRFFQYPADPATAEATYASLSKRFAITKYDNWFQLLQAFSERLFDRSSPHFSAVSKMDRDSDVVNMINDVQGRLKDIVKNIYRVFMEVHKHGIRIQTSSSVIEFDGKEMLRDRTRGLQNYTRYIESVVPDKSSFVRSELVSVIENMMTSMDPKLFVKCLEWMSDNFRGTHTGAIEGLLNDCLVHSFSYLSNNATLVRDTHDLPGILSRLRGTYTSSRSSDVILLSLREKTEHIARLATGNKNSNTLAALRTGILLYICLRTYTMQYYAQARLESPTTNYVK